MEFQKKNVKPTKVEILNKASDLVFLSVGYRSMTNVLVSGSRAPNPIAAITRNMINLIIFPEKQIGNIDPEYIIKAMISSFFGEECDSRNAQRNEHMPDRIRNIEWIAPTIPICRDKLIVISIIRGPNTDTDAHTEILIMRILATAKGLRTPMVPPSV